MYKRQANNSIPNYQVDAAGELILDADGNPVLDPDQPYRKLLGSISDQPDANGKYVVDPDGPVTAANISITDEWNADASYFVARKDDPVSYTHLDVYKRQAAECAPAPPVIKQLSGPF